MLYCTVCKQYAQQNGPLPYMEGDICPNCGQSRLIEKPSAGGFNINLGDANAISGGVNLHDSHNVHNEDNSVHNITNNSSVVNNIVERQKTASEELQEKKMQFNLLLEDILSDNQISPEEEVVLKNYQHQIGIDDTTAQILIDNARRRVRNSTRKESLGAAAVPVKQLTMLFVQNQTERILQMMPRMAALARNFKVDEVQHKFYMAQAAVAPEELIHQYESKLSDNYWRSYWAYIAYRKMGQNEKAEDILWGELQNYATYSPENTYLLQCVGELSDFGESAARETLNTVTGNFSPELKFFANALYLRLNPEIGRKKGATKSNCAFYDQNILTLESPQARAEREAKAEAERKVEEAKRMAEEEARIKVEQEAKRKQEEQERRRKEAEAKRKREEEERRRAEEQKRREEEARRRAAEAEAKRKAEEEARRIAAIEAQRREEEERKRKEAEAKRRREEEYRKRKEKERAMAEMEAKRRAEDKSTITASKTSLTFSADGGAEIVNINASGFWQLSAIPDNWAIVEERSNSIVVKVLENGTTKKRTDYLKIRCGYKDVRIDIIQEAGEKKAYVLKITKVTNMMLAMATARSAFGWDVGTSRTKFTKLPLMVKIENKQEAFNLYNKLSKGGMEVNASSVTASGKTINNCF